MGSGAGAGALLRARRPPGEWGPRRQRPGVRDGGTEGGGGRVGAPLGAEASTPKAGGVAGLLRLHPRGRCGDWDLERAARHHTSAQKRRPFRAPGLVTALPLRREEPWGAP